MLISLSKLGELQRYIIKCNEEGDFELDVSIKVVFYGDFLVS